MDTSLDLTTTQPGETTMFHQSLKSMAWQAMMTKRDQWLATARRYQLDPTVELGDQMTQAHKEYMEAEGEYNKIHLQTKYSRGTVRSETISRHWEDTSDEYKRSQPYHNDLSLF